MSVIISVAFAPDSKQVAAVSTTGDLLMWNLEHSRSVTREPVVFKLDNNDKELMKQAYHVSFGTNDLLLVGRGTTLYYIDAVIFQRTSIQNLGCDPEFLIRRISVPSALTSLAAFGDLALIGGADKSLCRIHNDGRMVRKTTLESPVTCMRLADVRTVVVGTQAGELLLVDIETFSVKSKTSGQPCPVENISVDPHGNWFAALVGSTVISGSTKSLVSVFETKITGSALCIDFVKVASSGLSLVLGSPVPTLRLLPLDLSSEPTTRLQFDTVNDLCGVTCMASSGGLLAVAGVGSHVLVLSNFSVVFRLRVA